MILIYTNRSNNKSFNRAVDYTTKKDKDVYCDKQYLRKNQLQFYTNIYNTKAPFLKGAFFIKTIFTRTQKFVQFVFFHYINRTNLIAMKTLKLHTLNEKGRLLIKQERLLKLNSSFKVVSLFQN